MNLYILDTDIWTLYRKGHPMVVWQVMAHAGYPLAVTVITVEEQLSGWYAKLRQARRIDEKARAYYQLADTVSALEGLQVLPFPEPALNRYSQLHGMKLNVGKKDLCIAAITLEFGGILVTRNLRDFQRVTNLIIENWAA